MLCLWHVHKAWGKNVIWKIANSRMRAEVLKGIVDIMYAWDGSKGTNAVTHTK